MPTIVLEGGNPLDLQQDAPSSVNVVRYEPNALEIEASTQAEGYLLLSDPFYPGWKAEMNGEPVPILRADYAFRAVAVPPGTHRVTMTFQPASWYAGLGLSAFTVTLLLISGTWALLRQRRQKP